MLRKEAARISALALYRFAILGLMGIFYGILIVLFFL
jgi:hypothetical protein